jgi:hypothetical protein
MKAVYKLNVCMEECQIVACELETKGIKLELRLISGNNTVN